MKNFDDGIIEGRPADLVSEHQYITFLTGEETYGVGVEKVKEIIRLTPVTVMPNTSEFMEGVINLRGTVVPVVDLRKKFGMPARTNNNQTVIIILETDTRLIGMIADSVSDVVDIQASGIQSAPHFAGEINIGLIKGIGQVNNNLIIILDADFLLSSAELKKINGSGIYTNDKE